MNTLGKILAVAVFVLSAAFMVSQMMLFAKRTDWRQEYKDTAQTLQSKSQALQEAQSTLDDKTQQFQQDRQRLQSKISSLQDQVESQSSAVADLKSEKSSLQDDLRKALEDVDTLTALSDKKEKMISELESENSNLQETVQEKVAKINELDNTIRGKDDKIASLNEDLQNLQDKYAATQDQKDKYASMLSRLSEKGIRVPAEDIKAVDGEIIKFDSGSDLVIINKGSESGVEVNYPFTIYRDGEYVAQAVVYRVDKKVSVARVQKEMRAEGKQIKEGDLATTRLVGTLSPISVSER